MRLVWSMAMSRNISLPEEIVRLAEKCPDATLPKGTTMETILDRDISFTPAELRW